jgi:hypothetical protein
LQPLSQVGDVLVDGTLRDTEPNGNVLGVVAGREGAQDVELPIGDGVLARSSWRQVGFCRKPSPSLSHRGERRAQRGEALGLRDKGVGAVVRGADAQFRNVPPGCRKDFHMWVRALDVGQQVDTVDVRQAEIEQHAVVTSPSDPRQDVTAFDLDTNLLVLAGKCRGVELGDAEVVIDDQDSHGSTSFEPP